MTGLVHSGLQTMMCVPFKIGVVELGSTELLLQGKNLDSPEEVVLRALTSRLDSTQSCNSKLENSNVEADDVPTVKS